MVMMSSMMMTLTMRDGDDAVLYIVLNAPVILSQKPTVGPPHSKFVYTIIIERGRFENTDSTTMKVEGSQESFSVNTYAVSSSELRYSDIK